MAELIFEIGCEELPAGAIAPALNAMASFLADELNAAGLHHGDPQMFGTPRRLGAVIRSLDERQEDREEQVVGPKEAIAFDEQGQPTKVAQGFARGHGLDVAELEIVDTPKGRCIGGTKQIKGKPTAALLEELLPKLLPRIPFRKSMRWNIHDETFARPIHWILAVLDGKVIPIHYAGVDSGNKSYGHRFLAPEAFKVHDAELFFRHLDQAYVVADINDRRDLIEKMASKLATEAGGKLIEDDSLLDEIANIVEYPTGLIGTFDEDYLQLPKEIPVLSMRSHQKYFALQDEKGRLLPKFIVFQNGKTEDPKMVVAGNERVLAARLSDARFFFNEDRKQPLESFVEGLKKVTFQEKLGSIHEKVERIGEHVRFLAPFIKAEALENALRAAHLCKADLQSAVVVEFPDLQGVMGRVYGLLDSEDQSVAEALEQHYWPRFADDELPTRHVAAIVALADKLDTIAGCFGVGLIPSGAADPYALRRLALGIIRILSDRGYNVPLASWIDFAVNAYGDKLNRDTAQTKSDIREFILGRYRNLRNRNVPTDLVDCVLSANFEMLPELDGKLAALQQFSKQPESRACAAAFKRVMNILKERPDSVVDPDLFGFDAEHELWNAAQDVSQRVGSALKKGEYLSALEILAELKQPVDRFFDDVLVMDKDEAVRNNRLSLLGYLADLFTGIADFRKIQTD